MDLQAKTLNNIIQQQNINILDMLSTRGKNIFFPKLGILAQSAQAKGKNINASIGEAVEDDGDAVVLSDLYWENYSLILENGYGAGIKTFELFNKRGFNFSSFTETLSSIAQEKIILLLNFPNNPAGYTPLHGEVDGIVNEIQRLADAGKRIIVLIDDAYFGLVYEDNVFKESIFTRIAGLHENVLAVKTVPA